MGNLQGTIQGLGANPELDLTGLTDNELVYADDAVESEFSGHPSLGRIRKNVKNELKKRVLSKPGKQNAPGEEGKGLFVNRIKEITDEQVVRDLQAGKLAVSDHVVYSQKSAIARTEMFLPADREQTGVTNVNNGKLKQHGAFLVTSIILLEGVADLADDTGIDTAFGKISKATANGIFTFRNGQKTFIEQASADCFNHAGNSQLLPGEFKLAIAKMIDPRSELTFDIDIPGAIIARTRLKVLLKGTYTVKA
jgi:hypothetical protein